MPQLTIDSAMASVPKYLVRITIPHRFARPYGEKAPILSRYRYHFHSFLVESSFLTAPGMHNANIASARLRDSLAICHRLVHLPATDPETFCHQNEIGQRFGAHFSHKAAPMNLHCLLGYPDPPREVPDNAAA